MRPSAGALLRREGNENGSIMKGSPFSSQADVAEALGLERKTGSILVGRYLKSGKAYKDRYTFFLSGVKG